MSGAADSALHDSLTVIPDSSVNLLGQGKKNTLLISFEYLQCANRLFCEGCWFCNEPTSVLESWSQNNHVQAGNLNTYNQINRQKKKKRREVVSLYLDV